MGFQPKTLGVLSADSISQLINGVLCIDFDREVKVGTEEVAVQHHHFRGLGGHDGSPWVSGILYNRSRVSGLENPSWQPCFSLA